MKFKNVYLLLTIVPLWLCSFQHVASAQLSTAPKPSAPTPTNIQPTASSATQVTNEIHPNHFDITGGHSSGGESPNVIHQFDYFDVGQHDSARFIVDPSVANVVSLISTPKIPSISTIDGKLEIVNNDSANLVLVNPAGIVFGENVNVQLLPGNLTAAASSGLLFEEQFYLSIDGSISEIALPESDIDSRGVFTDATIANLTGDPTGYFLFEPENANTTVDPLSTALPFGSIHNQGSLDLSSQSTLTLVGQYIQNDGEITTHGGSVNLAAATEDSLVRLSQVGNVLALDLISTDAILLRRATGIPEALTGGSDLGATQIETGDDGALTLTNTFSLMPKPGEVLVRGTIDVSSDSDAQGTVTIAGEHINLIDSDINADGSHKAGTISIGNDDGTGIVTTSTSVDRSSSLSADSSNGEGGVISIRATDTIRFYGNATADGASSTVDGTIELQAGEILDVR